MSPEVVLFSRSYRMAPNSLGMSSLNLLHFPCIRVCRCGVTDKLPSISIVSHGTDPSPRQTTKKCNSKIWLEDPTPKTILTKWWRCLPGSHFGKSYRIEFLKKSGVQQTCMSVYCWAPQWKYLWSLFLSLLRRGENKEKGINALKVGNIFLTPTAVCPVYLKNEVD